MSPWGVAVWWCAVSALIGGVVAGAEMICRRQDRRAMDVALEEWARLAAGDDAQLARLLDTYADGLGNERWPT